METIISSLVTGGVLLVLVGMIYSALVRRVDRVEISKVNTEKCDIIHRDTNQKNEDTNQKIEDINQKLEALFKIHYTYSVKLDTQRDLLIIISDNVKDLKNRGAP